MQARSRATRLRLLEAAIDTLIARGHAGASTTEICQRARVSQGALFKHFRSKRELLAETVEHLFARLIADFEAAFAALPEQPDRVAAAVRLLRETFAEPRLLAAFELYTAARTDEGLRAVLAPVMAAHRGNLRRAAERLFPAARRIDVVADAVVAAVQGAALGALVLPEPAAEARSLAWLEEVARQELGDV
ncbi:MAG: TetR/AcrR family transcriptional regulator [Myxococcota bacterium]